MQVSVTFRHMEPTDALKSFADEKVNKISKIIHSPTDAYVVLSVEKYMHKADITITANGITMRGKEKSEDMYFSIDRAMSKIERQAQRYHDKISSHKPREGRSTKVKLNMLQAAADTDAALQDRLAEDAKARFTEKNRARIVETKELDAKPMNVDEAIMQMELLHNDFLVFVNSETSGVSVLYRYDEDTFGLIDGPRGA
ncbi:MAG: ribosome-associated translation inhibitor RaiA [Deltaproteobacteria bacterium]|nr:ribosome-associated translation inhibitor RaiA [Deltaproteobacteria bacterium]